MKKILLALTILVAIPTAAAAQDQDTHTVNPGETLWNISQQYGVDYNELLEANPSIENANMIYANQVIQLPGQSGQAAQPTVQQQAQSESEFEQEVIRLTNEERTQRGLAPLESYSELSDVARLKSADMRDAGYFSHNSPNYGSPFDMMSSQGIDYRGAGENIAAGQRTPQQVVDGWMNSQGHRENILRADFTHIGVGHVEGGSYGHYWTQMFVTR
ncbi:CAP domain-containing protein [Thalassorhabdus alkalitolerans]|uniref:CAP domain-containing protein n=1 Tax=Thalassorhabdus alkalitolerans TaxID=2282697 RepID=A0ABW0YRN2_9BACI